MLTAKVSILYLFQEILNHTPIGADNGLHDLKGFIRKAILPGTSRIENAL